MSLTRKTLTSTIWAFATGYIGVVVSFAGNLVLARILLPEDFGVFAFALGLLAFLSMFTGFGSQEGIIQCRDEGIHGLIPTAFWMGFAIAMLVAIIGLIGGAILSIKHDATLGVLFILLAMFVPINSLANSHASLLMRDLNYKPVALTRTITSILSFALGIIAALAGLGPWALFVRQGLDSLIYWLIIKLMSSYRLEVVFDRKAAKWLWNFGWKQMVSQTSEVLVSRYDNVIVGLFLGSVPLGHYAQAFRLAGLGQQFTEGAIAPVLLPMFSTVQNSAERLQYGFQRVSYWLLRVIPIFGLFTLLLGKDAVVLVYGEKWDAAGEYFQMLFVMIMFVPFASALKNFLIGAGQISKVVRIKIFQFVFFVAGVSLGGLLDNIMLVIWVVNLNQVLGTLATGYFAYQLLRLNWMPDCAIPMLAFVLTAGAGSLLNLKSHSLLELAFGAFLITSVYSFIIVLYDHRALKQEAWILWKAKKA